MKRAERLVAMVLFWGGLLGVALMAAGVIDHAIRNGIRGEIVNMERVARNRERGQAADVVTSLVAIRRGLSRSPVDPIAVAALGIVVLLFTPGIAIGVALAAFALEHDRRYVIISAVLLGALTVGFLFGGA